MPDTEKSKSTGEEEAWRTLPDLSTLEAVRERLWERRAAAFVGAGFSRSAKVTVPGTPKPPLWSDLDSAFKERLYPENPNQAPGDLLRLAQEFQETHSRDALHNLISRLVADDRHRPGDNHINLLRLPWSDVFTTNYDTLLERVARQSGRRYSFVYNPSDLTRTRAPRIVKLHGSLPDHFPLVITEEDYRTYQKRLAPFVSLAQSRLAENPLVLIGFSGDDPNFLQWTGWVRDHLGPDALPVYFVTLDLPAPKRTLLERRGIAPIDLGPIVPESGDWMSTDDRYEAALRWLIAAFEDARPPDPLDWPGPFEGGDGEIDAASLPAPLPPSPHTRSYRSTARPTLGFPNTLDGNDEDPQDNEHLTDLLSRWREERMRYPGWVVPPKKVRDRLWSRTEHWNQEIIREIDSLEAPEDLRLLRELLWRIDRALLFISEGQELNTFLAVVLQYNPFPHQVDLSKIYRLFDTEQVQDGNESDRGGAESGDTNALITPQTHPSWSWSALTPAWVEVALSILRSFRENGQLELFEAWQNMLAPIVEGRAAWAARHACENALHHLGQLDFEATREVLVSWPDIQKEYPQGEVRRAALFAEVGDLGRASRIASNALNQILDAQATASQPSLRLYAQEKWARSLLKQLQRISSLSREPSYIRPPHESVRTPDSLGGSPSDRLREVSSALKRPFPDEEERTNVTPEFDLGRYSKNYRSGGKLDEFRPAFEFFRMREEGGVPIRAGRNVIDGEETTHAANWIRRLKPYWSWTILGRMAYQKSLEGILTRKRVAGFSHSHAQALYDMAYRGIEATWSAARRGSEHERQAALGRLEGLIDLLSRLSIRRDLGSEEALKLCLFLTHQAEIQESKNIYSKLGDLLERSTASLPEKIVHKYLDDVLSMPLPGRDLPSRGTIGRWFDPAQKLPQLNLEPELVRSSTVSQLVAVLRNDAPIPPDTEAEKESPVARLFATLRLMALYHGGGLTQEQVDDFSHAYWSHEKAPGGLPDIPEAEYEFSLGAPPPPTGPGRAERVRQALLGAEDLAVGEGGVSIPGKAHVYLSAVRRASLALDGHIPGKAERVDWSPEEALKLLDLITNLWDTDSARYESEREKEKKQGFVLMPTSDVIGEQLRLIPLTLRDAVLSRIEASEAHKAHRVLDEMQEAGFAVAVAYPDLLRLGEVTAEEARDCLRQHLAESDAWPIEFGARAVQRWVRLWHEGEVSASPERLLGELVTLITARRRPGLATVLEVLSEIIDEVPATINQEQATRLVATLTFLREETAPPSCEQAWRSAVITRRPEIRSRGEQAAATALAFSLHNWYSNQPSEEVPDEIERWQALATSSPVPEVYNAWGQSAVP